MDKIQQYLDAGTRLVRGVNPEERTVRIFRANGTFALAGADAVLDGEGVLPGLRPLLSEVWVWAACSSQLQVSPGATPIVPGLSRWRTGAGEGFAHLPNVCAMTASFQCGIISTQDGRCLPVDHPSA